MPCHLVVDFIKDFLRREKSCKERRHLSFVRRLGLEANRPKKNQHKTAVLAVVAVTLTPNQYHSQVRFSGCLIALQAGLKASLQGKFVWRAPV